MPCNTIVTNTVELAKVARDHPELLERALRAEFGDVTVRGAIIATRHGAAAQSSEFLFTANGVRVLLRDGKAVSTMSEIDLRAVVTKINQGVGRAAVHMSAQRFGWTVVRGADANHFQLRKG